MGADDENIARLRRALARPIAPSRDLHGSFGEDDEPEFFDPWDLFPCFYGSYSAEFDEMAICVLENIRHKRFGAQHGEFLAHEMFREVLCTSNFCDYGTSPRGCFPNWENGFGDLLPMLIERWKEYAKLMWGEIRT